MRTLRQLLEDRKYFKNFTLFFDIETFQFNEQAGKKFPSRYKNMTFAVGISWVEAGEVEYQIFPSFKEVFDLIIQSYKNNSHKPNIIFNAHNTNKYDNHFLRKDLMYYYPTIEVENYWINTATNEKSNELATRIKDLTKEDKKAIILEKRIKSSINLEMIIYLDGIQIKTMDNWVKTNASIAMLGKKLKRLGVVTDDQLKTDFNYTKYNLSKDLTEKQARQYAREIFNQLSKDEITYIENDVILLAKSVYYYSDLFNGFDYSKMTFTSNILDSYNDNDLTSFQLLNRVGQGKDKIEVRYTDYKFANQNFYDYLKPFYRGGLNFYNHNYIGQIIKDGVFGMDIHSSYPYAMHKFKIPTYLKDFESYDKPKMVGIEYDHDQYSLYKMNKKDFDNLILDQIQSVIFKQILVKYYSTDDTININTYTFRMLSDILNIHLTEIPAYSKVTFETEYFGSRDQIAEFYKIKTQGDTNRKIIFNSPYDIKETNEINENVLSPEEYDNSKVNLNGLYGIPALRPYFNLFRMNKDGEYINIENGHKNAERNIVFSIFVTSVSLWNLLYPLKYLTENEIDENLLYTDTDSLYIKRAVKDKIPDYLFSEFSLGKWDLEHENLKNFYVLNHKKYAYTDDQGQIKVRAGGIPNKSFNTDMSFEEFIKTQFSHGVKLKTIKSIYNAQETISIYPSITHLEIGKNYRIVTDDNIYQRYKEKMFKEIKKYENDFTNDLLYIESIIGTFSIGDLYPFKHETDKKRSLVFLKIRQEQIQNMI